MQQRSLTAQLSTATGILALFIAQTDEFDAMNRDARRSPRGRELSSRIEALREGRSTWELRVNLLLAEIGISDEESQDTGS